MSFLCQHLPERLIVIDLSVKDKHHTPVLIVHGLHPRIQVDDTKPAERLYIIKNQEECNSIFIEPQSVDFEKEMILVYIGSTVNSRSVIVKQVKLEEKKLKVEFTVKKGKRGYKDSSMPKRRLILIKIAKLDIDAVEFAEI